MRKLIIAAFLALLPAALLVPATARADSYEEHYTLDVQMHDFVNRLYAVMTREDWLGKDPTVRGMADVFKKMGMFDFSGMDVNYHLSGGKMHCDFGETYAGVSTDTYIGKVLALPNSALSTASYVNTGDYVLLMGMNNVPQQAMLYLNEFGKMASQATPGSPLDEMLGGSSTEIAQGLAMLDAFQVEEQVNSVLSGDLSVVLFDLPSIETMDGDMQPGDVHAALLVGLRSGEQLRQLASTFAPQAGLEPMTGDMQGWTGYYIPDLPEGGIMFNDKVLIASPNIYDTLGRLNFANGGLVTPACQCYFDANLTKMQDGLIGPAAQALIGESELDLSTTQQASAYLFALPPSEALGHVTSYTTYEGDSYRGQMEMNTALANYFAYYVSVGLCGAVQADSGGGYDESMDDSDASDEMDDSEGSDDADEPGDVDSPDAAAESGGEGGIGHGH